MGSPVLNVSVHTPTTKMEPCMAHASLGLFKDMVNMRTGGLVWVNTAGSEWKLDLSALEDSPSVVYGLRMFERYHQRDVKTGFQWTLSASGTSNYYLEAGGGGDPGLFADIDWPFDGSDGHVASGVYVRVNGVQYNDGQAGALAASRWGWGDHGLDNLGFTTIYVRTTTSSDPDSETSVDFSYNEPMVAGAIGALNAGEYAYDSVNNEVHVRLRGSGDPNALTDGYLRAHFHLSSTGVVGEEDLWEDCTVEWEVIDQAGDIVTTWDARYREIKDTRRTAPNDTIDLSTKDVRSGFANYLLSAGTYKFRARAFNKDGDSATAESGWVTVAANTRTKKTIKAVGGDYLTLAAALAVEAGNNNIWYEIEAGHSETLASGTTITGSNAFFSVAGAGVATFSLSLGAFLIQASGENVVVDGLTFTPTRVETTTNVFDIKGEFFTITNCVINGLFSGNIFNKIMRGDSDPRYILWLKNVVGDYRSYIITHESNNEFGVRDFFAAGNSIGSSTNESAYRPVASNQRWGIIYDKIDFTNVPSKSALRCTRCNGLWMYGCNTIDGEILTGNVNWCITRGIRVEACIAQNPQGTGIFANGPGMRRVRILSSVSKSKVQQFSVQTSTYAAMQRGIKVICCTLWRNYTATNVAMMTLPSTFYTNGRHYGLAMLGNCFRADAADPFTAFFTLNSSYDQTSFYWDQNQLPDPADWGSTQVANVGGAKTLAQWNALSIVGTDYTKSTTFGANWLPASPQTITTPSGVHYDLWGSVRSATDYAGAVVAADPGPTAPTPPSTPAAIAGVTTIDWPLMPEF